MVTPYPISLRLAGQQCLVIGGGRVAERKIRTLLEHGGLVNVISPRLTDALFQMKQQGQIRHVANYYHREFLHGVFLVICASDSDKVNHEVANDCFAMGILVNVVDDPDYCSFFVPSSFRRGDLTISISTGGKSPMLAQRLRQQLEQHFGPEYGELVRIMGDLRQMVRQRVKDSKKRRLIYACLLDSDILDLLRNGQIDLVKERIEQCMYW